MKIVSHSSGSLIATLLFVGAVLIPATGLSENAASIASAPRLDPAPEYGHWLVLLQYPEESGKSKEAPVNRLSQIEVIKTPDIRRDVITYSDGTIYKYDRKGAYVWLVTGEKVDLAMPPAGVQLYPFYSNGYTFMDWVEPRYFVDQAKYHGKLCYHYRRDAQQAWIAVESQLPVAATSPNGIEAVFRFYEKPSAIQLSAEQEQLLQQQLKAVKKFESIR